MDKMKNAAKALALLATGAAIGGGTATLAAPDIAYRHYSGGEVLTRDATTCLNDMAKMSGWPGQVADMQRACMRVSGEQTYVTVYGKHYAPKSELPPNARIIKE